MENCFHLIPQSLIEGQVCFISKISNLVFETIDPFSRNCIISSFGRWEINKDLNWDLRHLLSCNYSFRCHWTKWSQHFQNVFWSLKNDPRKDKCWFWSSIVGTKPGADPGGGSLPARLSTDQHFYFMGFFRKIIKGSAPPLGGFCPLLWQALDSRLSRSWIIWHTRDRSRIPFGRDSNPWGWNANFMILSKFLKTPNVIKIMDPYVGHVSGATSNQISPNIRLRQWIMENIAHLTQNVTMFCTPWPLPAVTKLSWFGLLSQLTLRDISLSAIEFSFCTGWPLGAMSLSSIKRHQKIMSFLNQQCTENNVVHNKRLIRD